jgi:hypothetical protein
MKVRREWRVQVTPEDTGESWPDTQSAYSALIFRPSVVAVTFHRDDDGPIRNDAVAVIGLRVLKSGKTGATAHDRRFYGYENKPAWVEHAVACAAEVVKRDGQWMS